MSYSRSHANRGKFLETLIDRSNIKYFTDNIADIRKVPTPFKPLSTKGGRVTGYFEKPEWVDYSGIFEGQAIIFDAKQTATTNLPLSNISQHQYELLKSWHYKGARAFLIVYFSKEDEYYYLPFKALQYAWERAENGGRKSIAHAEFTELAHGIKLKSGILDYLEVIACDSI